MRRLKKAATLNRPSLRLAPQADEPAPKRDLAIKKRSSALSMHSSLLAKEADSRGRLFVFTAN
jgi:hypothetical protein